MIARFISCIPAMVSVTLSLALHGAAFTLNMAGQLRDGAIDVPTAAISINLTHTEILEAVAAPEENAQSPASEAVGQSGQDTPAAEDGELKPDDEAKAKRAAEAEARAKAEADAKAKAEAERRAEAEAEAERRRKAAEAQRRWQASRAADAGAKARSAAPTGRQATAARVSASAGRMRSYQTQVRAHIARNRPRGLPGKSGMVHVAFGLSETGKLTRIKLLRSSGDPAIDQAVLSALRHAAPFPRAPQGSTPAQRYFNMPFEFNFR
jgi:TolA protein